MARSKDKKRETENGEGDENNDDTKTEEPTLDYDELVKRVCAIAKPLAGRKLTKRLYKTVKKGERLDTHVHKKDLMKDFSPGIKQLRFSFNTMNSFFKLPEGREPNFI